MSHERITPIIFDSAQFAIAKKSNGKYSYYASLRVMHVSASSMARFARAGLIDGNRFDTWTGLSVGELASLSTAVAQLKSQGKILTKKPKQK